MKFLVTGATGLLGRALTDEMRHSGAVMSYARHPGDSAAAHLDVTDAQQVPDALVIRIPILYGTTGRRTFPQDVIESLRVNRQIAVDDSEVRQPTLADDAAKTIAWLVESKMTGIVHVAPLEHLTKFAWAQKIAQVLGYSRILIEGTPKCDGPISRPLHSLLATRQLQSIGAPLPRSVSDVIADPLWQSRM